MWLLVNVTHKNQKQYFFIFFYFSFNQKQTTFLCFMSLKDLTQKNIDKGRKEPRQNHDNRDNSKNGFQHLMILDLGKFF